MDKLHYQLKELTSRNRDGSFSTQSNRHRILQMCADHLKDGGYRTRELSVNDIKGRHVNALLRRWRADGVSTGTIKNRLSAVRWWADKVNNAGAVKSNDELNIENRQYITNADKSLDLSSIDKSAIKSDYIMQSLKLQQNFGLRREEAMKFNPAYALQGKPPAIGDIVRIKPSWSKGGRYREIPIINQQQVDALNDVINLVGNDASLIPADKSYRQHLTHFEKQTSIAGIGQTHGLRHRYAQMRYKSLTGFDCPAVGGVRTLTDDEKVIDKQARQMISNELGHNRLSVTGVYLGSWGRQ